MRDAFALEIMGLRAPDRCTRLRRDLGAHAPPRTRFGRMPISSGEARARPPGIRWAECGMPARRAREPSCAHARARPELAPRAVSRFRRAYKRARAHETYALQGRGMSPIAKATEMRN